MRRASSRALRTDFLIHAAVLALDRWDRLTPEEKQRFRELGRAAAGAPSQHLSRPEQRELLVIWKKLGVRKLLAKLVRILASRDGASTPDGLDENDIADPVGGAQAASARRHQEA